MRHHYDGLFVQSQNRPVSVAIQLDHTPMVIPVFTTLKFGDITIRRQAAQGMEFLMMREMVTTEDCAGNRIFSTKVSMPTTVTSKEHWTALNCLKNFVSLGRSLNHKGILLYALPMDGGLMSVQTRRFKQLLDLQYKDMPDTFETRKLQATEWTHTVLDGYHVAANALRHGTIHLLTSERQDLKIIHNAARAVKQSTTDVLCFVNALAQQFTFRPSTGAEHAIRGFWYTCKLEAQISELLIDLDLEFDGDNFTVKQDCTCPVADIPLHIIMAYAGVLQVENSKDTRWNTHGDLGSAFTALWALGLDPILNKMRTQGILSEYYSDQYFELQAKHRPADPMGL